MIAAAAAAANKAERRSVLRFASGGVDAATGAILLGNDARITVALDSCLMLNIFLGGLVKFYGV